MVLYRSMPSWRPFRIVNPSMNKQPPAFEGWCAEENPAEHVADVAVFLLWSIFPLRDRALGSRSHEVGPISLQSERRTRHDQIEWIRHRAELLGRNVVSGKSGACSR